MRLWMSISQFPLALIGTVTGTELYAADRKRRELMLRAEFDATLASERDAATRAFFVALARLVVAYALFILLVPWMLRQ